MRREDILMWLLREGGRKVGVLEVPSVPVGIAREAAAADPVTQPLLKGKALSA